MVTNWSQHVSHRLQNGVNLLFISSISCECQRCFSAAGRTIIIDRNSLCPTTIEALQLQKNLLKHYFVESFVLKLSDRLCWKEKIRNEIPEEGIDSL